jgi:hypothetical protein
MDMFVKQSPNSDMISVHLAKNGKEISVLFKRNSRGEWFVWESLNFPKAQLPTIGFVEIDEAFLN